jgi:hypothetical protein
MQTCNHASMPPTACKDAQTAKLLKSMKPIIEKIESHWKQLVDATPEKHFVHAFGKRYKTVAAQKEVMEIAKGLIEPSCHAIKQVPLGAEAKFTMSMNQFCFGNDMSIKGESRMGDTWDKLMMFFPHGMRSDESIMPFFKAAPNATIVDLSVNTRNGMAKLCAACMISTAAADVLSAEEIQTIKPVLRTFGAIQCSWDNNRDVSSALTNAIGLKIGRSLTSRPDPEQLLCIFERQVEIRRDADVTEGKKFAASQYLDLCVNNYNGTQSAKEAM